MNEIQNTQKARHALKKSIRAFFDNKNYTEVETPINVMTPGTEVHLDYFRTQWVDHQNKSQRLYQRSSPELHMKKLLAADMDKIYQISPCFRNNGEFSEWHHPEFSMLEWYQTTISFTDFIKQTISLLRYNFEDLQNSGHTSQSFNFPHSFHYLTVKEAFQKFCHIELIDRDKDLAKKLKSAGLISIGPNDDFETSFFKALIEKVEPGLEALHAVVLYDYPESQSALAKKENGVAKRFEIYWNRVELCNGFLELTDPLENKERLIQSNKERLLLGKQELPLDHYFIESMKNLPPCCGNALGLDRWLAILLGLNKIDSVIPFRSEYLQTS